MKIILLMLLGIVAVISMATIAHDAFHPSQQPINLKADTIPAKQKDIQFKYWNDTMLSIINAHFIRVPFDTSFLTVRSIRVNSYKGRTVAYKHGNSAWVILDSAETLKVLLWQIEQQMRQSKMHR